MLQLSLRVNLVVSLFCAMSAFTATFLGRARDVSVAVGKSKSIPFLHEPKNLAGMVGDKGFDPIGFSDAIDPKFLREAELKHGRTAMLGALGFVVSEFFKLPGEVHNVSPVAAHDVFVATGAMSQILVLVIALEAVSTVAVVQMMEGSDRKPGDFYLRLFGYDKTSDKAKADLQLKELENGRLAVSTVYGMKTKQAMFLHSLYVTFLLLCR